MTIQSFQELLITNYGLLPSGYTGSRGDIGYTGSTGTSAGVPKITAIQVTNSSGTVLDDTAVDVAGGHILITGTGFESGCTVMVNNVPASSTTFVSGTQVRAQLPATAAGTYVIYLVNTDGGVAIRINGITFSTTPTWTTGSTLPAGDTGGPISIQLAAAGATTFSLAAGSTLPGTLTVSSSGLLSGTVPNLVNETTYSFTIVATDTELQDSPRTFTITITAGDSLFAQTTLLLPGTTSTSIFNDDASTNNFPISIFGDTRPNNFNPYTPGYYSNFFDGTGDFLRVPSTGAGFSSITTFTYECWIQPTSALGTNCIFDISESQPFRFVLSGSNVTWQASSSGSTILTATFTWVIGAWHHVAFVRDSSNNISIFINGTRYATANFGGNWGSTAAGGVNIGCNRGDTWFFPGYISNARFVKGTAVYDPTQTTITVPTTPLTAVSGTSLLTCQSNRFIDNSADNLTVTRNGDVTVNSFDPFVPSSSTATLGSTYFDGNGDYLSATTGNLGSGDFTVEYWVYYTSFYNFITNLSTTRGSTGWSCGSQSAGQIVWYSSGAERVRGTTQMIPNTWNHVAFVRSGGTLRGYLNGVQNGTTSTETTNFTNTSFAVGRLQDATPGEHFTGYMSNIRLVAGTAVYTANFTPPTAPLTAIANTILLTCQTNQPVENNDFLDSSTNNFLVTRNGNTTQGTFSPYAENWSNYFDGSGDDLTVPTNAAFTYGTGDFCIEGWFYFTGGVGGSGYSYLFAQGASTGAASLGLYIQDGVYKVWNGSAVITSAASFVQGSWVHLAVTRSGTTMRLFVNGVQSGSATNSSNITTGSTLGISIGRWAEISDSNYITGYVSNFRVVKGTAVYTSNFTPSTTPLQPITNTSLLTCRDSSFVDDSANRFAITRNGNVSVQKTGPFAGTTLPTPYYGAYFDGNGDYLSASGNIAFAMSTENFTLEAWINPISISSYFPIIGQWPSLSTGSGFFLFPINSSRQIELYYDGQTYATFSSATVTLNTWNHVAIVRSGSTITGYINGVVAGTVTYSGIFGSSSTNLEIGGTTRSGGNLWANGYISNVRVVKGTALYTTNFTPPTQPLTAITNTSLLTCQSATFIDNSTNNFAITAFGNSQPTFFNPFTVTYSTLQSYSPSVFGGSMYFDGTGDFLTVPDNTTLQMSTGDFTIEFWINFSSIAGYQTPYDKGYTNAGGLLFQTGNGNGRMIIYASGSAVITESGTGSVGEWIHYALVRRGTTLTLYRNGTSSGTATNSTNFNNSSQLGIGATGVAPAGGSIGMYAINGYLSNVRVVKGTAIYTSNFVPSNQPLTAVQNSVLLLNGTAGGIIDVSSGNNLETVGDARLSVVQTKWPSTSMFFDGTDDYLLAAPSNNLEFGSGDFTIEFWLYRVGTGRMALYHGSFGTDWSIGIDISSASPNTSNTIGIWASSNGTAWNLINADLGGNGIGTIPVAQNTWTHIAYVRSGTTWRLFVNGVVDRNLTGISGSIVNRATSPKAIGAWFSTGSLATLNGYLQDFRITRGTARYTANFTPPAAAFQTR